MRFALSMAGAALAFAAPALSQTTPPVDPARTTQSAAVAPATGGAPIDPAAVAPATPAAAAAPDATAAVVNPAVGVIVLDPTGVPVGTIKAIDAQYVTLATDRGEARLPIAGVGPGHGGAAVGLTKAQIDAAVVQAKAAEPAAKTTTTTRTTTTKRR